MILITILTLAKMILAGYIISTFAPVGWVLELLPDKLVYNIIKLLFTCGKCATFWFTLVYTGDFFMAAASSLGMEIFEKTIGKWIRRVEF